MNQEFEIVKDENIHELEIEVRNKIKTYNERGYTCISQSISQSISRSKGLDVMNYWVISLLFEPGMMADDNETKH
jgi:hypothetical protein